MCFLFFLKSRLLPELLVSIVYGIVVSISDAPCTDSIECADRCCRRKRMGKMGFKKTCGKPGEYTCVGRQILPYSRNDLYNDY